MKRSFFVFVLFLSAALGQPAVLAPIAGTIRDTSGSLHSVVGVAGNFLVSDAAGIPDVLSSAFSASAGLAKTDGELLILDASGQISARFDAPPGPALFAFDAAGAPALAYCSGTLFSIDSNGLNTVNWTGDAVSIALSGPRSATAIVRRDDRFWKVRFSLSTGDVESETVIPNAAGPILQLQNGDLMFTRGGDIVVRDASSVERLLTAGFPIDSFEPMGPEWIAVRETGATTLFALRVTARNIEMYQLPEVSQ